MSSPFYYSKRSSLYLIISVILQFTYWYIHSNLSIFINHFLIKTFLSSIFFNLQVLFMVFLFCYLSFSLTLFLKLSFSKILLSYIISGIFYSYLLFFLIFHHFLMSFCQFLKQVTNMSLHAFIFSIEMLFCCFFFFFPYNFEWDFTLILLFVKTFLMWTMFKVFIEFVTILFLFSVFIFLDMSPVGS